jgi:hypothetical protein
VKPSSNIDPERTNFFDDCAGAADCAPRPVEGDEEAVTGRVGLASAKAHNVSSNRGIMFVEQVAPAAITESGRFLGRADNVSEKNGGKHPVGSDRRFRAGQKLLNCIGNLCRVLARLGSAIHGVLIHLLSIAAAATARTISRKCCRIAAPLDLFWWDLYLCGRRPGWTRAILFNINNP